jgi:hypothetical protein
MLLGSGVEPGITTSNESAVAPEPQVHVYVPGVRPRPVMVVLSHVALPDKAVPEV